MLGQSLYIKSRGPGQLTLGLGRWEVTRGVGVGRVYAGVTEGRGKGKCLCVFCAAEIERECLSACIAKCTRH